MTVVVMAPVVMVVVPIVVVVMMMPMVMMVTPVVPMMAVVPVVTMMTPHVGPISRHGSGGQIGILRHGGCVDGRLGGRGRRSHACRDGGEHQQPLEHEISSRDFCGTHSEG
jgi:hypothetical protein